MGVFYVKILGKMVKKYAQNCLNFMKLYPKLISFGTSVFGGQFGRNGEVSGFPGRWAKR